MAANIVVSVYQLMEFASRSIPLQTFRDEATAREFEVAILRMSLMRGSEHRRLTVTQNLDFGPNSPSLEETYIRNSNQKPRSLVRLFYGSYQYQFARAGKSVPAMAGKSGADANNAVRTEYLPSADIVVVREKRTDGDVSKAVHWAFAADCLLTPRDESNGNKPLSRSKVPAHLRLRIPMLRVTLHKGVGPNSSPYGFSSCGTLHYPSV